MKSSKGMRVGCDFLLLGASIEQSILYANMYINFGFYKLKEKFIVRY